MKFEPGEPHDSSETEDCDDALGNEEDDESENEIERRKTLKKLGKSMLDDQAREYNREQKEDDMEAYSSGSDSTEKSHANKPESDSDFEVDDENESFDEASGNIEDKRILRKRSCPRISESSQSSSTKSSDSRSCLSSSEYLLVRKKKRVRQISITSIESENLSDISLNQSESALEHQQVLQSDQNVIRVFSSLHHSVSYSAESDYDENPSIDENASIVQQVQQVHATFHTISDESNEKCSKYLRLLPGRREISAVVSLENTQIKVRFDNTSAPFTPGKTLRNSFSSNFCFNDSTSIEKNSNQDQTKNNDSVTTHSFNQQIVSDSPSLMIVDDNDSTAFDIPPESENSNSTMSYFEKEFPKNILRPWLALENVKNNREIAQMLTKTCLKSTYKCMGLCSFFSDQLDTFKVHLQLHSKDEINHESTYDYKMCSYCDFVAADDDDLISHLNNMHQNDQFSCKKCFYRSIVKENVTNHFIRFHSNEMFYIADDERKISCSFVDAAVKCTEQRSKFVSLIRCPGEFESCFG